MDSGGIEIARSLVAPILDTTTDLWGVALGDRIAAWRLRNVIETHRKLQDEAQAAGITLNVSKIPERFAVAWFEAASQQDEPDLQTMFARLLAGVAAERIAPDARLVRKLKDLEPADAIIFREFYSLTPEQAREINTAGSRYLSLDDFQMWLLEGRASPGPYHPHSFEILNELGLLKIFETNVHSPRTINRKLRPNVLREEISIERKQEAILQYIGEVTARSECITSTTLGEKLAHAVLKPLADP